MPLSSCELRALEYRKRAQVALDAAKACSLDRAREQHFASALRWFELAQGEAARARTLRARPPAPAPQSRSRP